MAERSNVVPLAHGFELAAARLGQGQAELHAIQLGTWLDWQRSVRGLGVPVHTKQWSYQWPVREVMIEVTDKDGDVIVAPARLSVTGILRHVARSKAVPALRQMSVCQTRGVPFLPAAEDALWKVIEARTSGYRVVREMPLIGSASEDFLPAPVLPTPGQLSRQIQAEGVDGAQKYNVNKWVDEMTRIADLLDMLQLSSRAPDAG